MESDPSTNTKGPGCDPGPSRIAGSDPRAEGLHAEHAAQHVGDLAQGGVGVGGFDQGGPDVVAAGGGAAHALQGGGVAVWVALAADAPPRRRILSSPWYGWARCSFEADLRLRQI